MFPPSLVGKGARGLGFSWIFPHGVKSQVVKSTYSIQKSISVQTSVITENFTTTSTARRKSKVKSQKSKVLWNGLFVDFKWLLYLRRDILVVLL